ncbi:MAG: DNA methyltransferase [Planctomycetota bacterium]
MPKPYFQSDRVTIYHGDCFDILPGLSNIGAVVTDPPYSSGGSFRGDRMQSTSTKYQTTGLASYHPDFSGDNRDQRSFGVWCAMWMNACRLACVAGAPFAAFIDWRQLPTLSDAVQVAGWQWRGIGVWTKKNGRPTPGRFTNCAEYLLWGSKGPMPKRDVYPKGTFECPTVSGKDRVHSTQKPELVMRWALSIVPDGATVLDPFMGSGSTLRAAMDCGLPAIGIDADEHWCEIAAKRCKQMTLV